ncbi:MAG: hypothetical protein BMS9Abin18_0212 [Zetaproteobacteria bacterium]|nr:MAG: hypothetical protein BMS9Abin18_0212 [Zetaproteobacteria bacterium]
MKRAGNRKGKGGDQRLKGRAILGHHLITAFHAADRGFQNTETVIPVFSARWNHGLLANHAFTLHLLHLAIGVGNKPVATDELGRNCPFIADADMINKNKLVLFRIRMFFCIFRSDSYGNRIAFIIITNDRRRILPSLTG